MQEKNNNRADNSIREKMSGYQKQPADRIWDKLQPQLADTPVQEKPRRAGLLWLFLLGLLLLITGNLLPRVWQPEQSVPTRQTAARNGNQEMGPGTESGRSQRVGEASVPETDKAAPAQAERLPVSAEKASRHGAAPAAKKPAVNSRAVRKTAAASVADNTRSVFGKNTEFPGQEKAELSDETQAPAAVSVTANAGPGIPAVLQTLVQLEQQAQPYFTASDSPKPSRQEVIATLQAGKKELAALQHRADSLLMALSPEYAELPEKPQPVATGLPAIPRQRWSVALAVAPEHSFMKLRAPEADTLVSLRRNHETGRSGINAALSLEYQLSEKLRVGAGAGYSTYGAELRLTSQETLLDVRYDTTTTITTSAYSNTYTNFIVRDDSTAILDPIFNQSGQVIGYNTVYVTHPDTTWHTVVVEGTDTVRQQTITPLIHQTEVTTYRKLKPQYNFVTLPVMLHYRLTAGSRLWTEIGVGGQLQFFRGGTQLVTTDGRSYRTEKIGSREGPFRPVNVALMGNLSVNYGLTQRLSLSMAPAVRWQVQSVYKKETGLRQNPVATGLQFGLRYAF